jgi:exosortase/archaeosortase family protein
MLATRITHPTDQQYELIVLFMKTYDPIGKQFVATVLYAALFLPLMPSLLLFLPKDFIRRHITAFIVGFFLLFFYIFVHPLEAFYHILTGPTLIRLVGAVLQFLPGEAIFSPERWEVSYRGFMVVIGPLCSGFTAKVLFVAIFCVLWWLLSKRGGVYHGRAVLALVSGVVAFYFINILRIVLIMIIGSFSRTLGMTLFHGTAGSLFFFLMIICTIYYVLPVMKKDGRGKTR